MLVKCVLKILKKYNCLNIKRLNNQLLQKYFFLNKVK